MPKDIFYSDFKTHSFRDWEKIAQKELENKSPWENLTKAKHAITIKPYYDRSDSVEEKKLRFSGASWLNIPKVIVNNEKKANDDALTHLNTGADGIWFEILKAVEPNKLLDKIELSACSLYFRSNDEVQLNLVADFIESKSSNEKITGAFFIRENKNIGNRTKSWKNFHTHGIIINKTENVVDEIVDSLLTTVDRVEQLMKREFSAEEAFRSIAFSISVDPDFFLSVAKIRALKNLWITLQEAYKIRNPIPAYVHGYSQPWIKENFQPHGNMLKQTTAAMACAMSGCNAITIEPESFDNKMMSRIAQNVSLMLREESHLAKVSDPLAGSFYVDALTHQIAKDAWEKFKLQVG